MALFAEEKPSVVVNLAAQAGVRYSLENPATYIQSNLVGFGHLLEGCRHYGTHNLVYASSSSVYGGNRNLPFHEQQPVNHPVSQCRHQKVQRADGAHLQSSLRIASDWTAFFHRLWALGASRHGTHAVCQGHPGGRADQGF